MGGRKPKRIALLGLFGVGNLGNEATLEVTLHHLRKRVPDSQVVCVCARPSEVAEAFGISTTSLETLRPWSFWRLPGRLLRDACVVIATLLTEPVRRRRVARALAGVDQLVVVGTGILDDFGEVPWQMPARLWRWCDVARKMDASVEYLAVGAGPIHHRFSRRLMLRATQLADRRSFRDNVSKEFMASLGLDTARDRLLPDLVFGFPRERLPPAREPSDPPRIVGVGLMGYYGWSDDRERGKRTYAAYLEKMTGFVSWLLDNGYAVRFLIGQRGADETAANDLRAALGTRVTLGVARLAFDPIDSFDQLLAQVAEVDMVVASRYHNLIGALLLGRPVISIGYSDKFEALMHEMALEAYCQDIESIDVPRLVAQFQGLARDHAGIAAGIREKCAQLQARVEQGYDSLWS